MRACSPLLAECRAWVEIVSKRAFLGFGLLFAILILNSGLAGWHVIRIREMERESRRSQQVLGELEAVSSRIKDAERGQEGYLLTGDEDSFGLYRQASGDQDQGVRASLDRLKDLVRENPDLHRRPRRHRATRPTPALAPRPHPRGRPRRRPGRRPAFPAKRRRETPHGGPPRCGRPRAPGGGGSPRPVGRGGRRAHADTFPHHHPRDRRVAVAHGVRPVRGLRDRDTRRRAAEEVRRQRRVARDRRSWASPTA